jgi:Fur family transcriptional regulator, ferric uptake regulator
MKDQRQTRQRAAIREAFERADRPLTPAQVLKAAQKRAKGLGIATVYRNIGNLVEEGWLSVLELPGALTLYERSGKSHHHHFFCDECTRVFEVSGCLPRIDRLVGSRFHVRRHELVLYGTCAECVAQRSN